MKRNIDLNKKRNADGIICFGSQDWWYHNRGHYDLQMMREFSKELPVLYVNSIGMRPPKLAEGSMFFKRIKRKLKSLMRGLVRVRENFVVFSPVTIPGGGNGRLSAWFSNWALVLQVKFAAWRCNIKHPIVWIACPPAEPISDQLNPAKLVYQRTDRFEDYAGVDANRIKEFDKQLKQKSDLVLFCSRELFSEESKQNKKSIFVDHGVDYKHFFDAGVAFETHKVEPTDIQSIPHPRVGFIGGIDAHTFDPDLFVSVVAELPEVEFVMIGACSLPDGWCPHKNVHFLGQRPYEDVAAYMAACEVLIMPWNQSDWIKACNPVKMKEYLAVGRPIVSTYFPEIEFFKEHISVVQGAEEFGAEITRLISEPGDTSERRNRVRNHTWEEKSEEVFRSLEL